MNSIEQQMKHAHALLDKAEGLYGDDWLFKTLQREQGNPETYRRKFEGEWKTVPAPKEDGEYYEVPLLVLNKPTFNGRIYTDVPALSEERLKELKESQLRVEVGMPRREFWMTDSDWNRRINSIDESCVGGQLSNVRRVEKDGVTMVVGDFKPTGPAKALVDEMHSIRDFNISIRANVVPGRDRDKLGNAISEIIAWNLVPKE